MIGNLEPEEHVMDDSVRYPGKMLGELAIALEKLGWEYGDYNRLAEEVDRGE